MTSILRIEDGRRRRIACFMISLGVLLPLLLSSVVLADGGGGWSRAGPIQHPAVGTRSSGTRVTATTVAVDRLSIPGDTTSIQQQQARPSASGWLSSSTSTATRRFLSDKWHPEKDDIFECLDAQGQVQVVSTRSSSSTTTRSSSSSSSSSSGGGNNRNHYEGEDDAYEYDDDDDDEDDDEDDDKPVGNVVEQFFQELGEFVGLDIEQLQRPRPPCRDDDTFVNDDSNTANAPSSQPQPVPIIPVPEPITSSPAPSPSNSSSTVPAIPALITIINVTTLEEGDLIRDDDSNTNSSNGVSAFIPSPSPRPEEVPVVFEIDNVTFPTAPVVPVGQIPVPAPVPAPPTASPSSSLRPPPTSSPTPAPTPDEPSYLDNIVKIRLSVALPPQLDYGIPEQVTKAVTKLLNISSALTHNNTDVVADFLAHHDPSGSTAATVGSLLGLTTLDLPLLLDPAQPLWFHLRYGPGFRFKQSSKAFFWEMVHKDTHAKRVAVVEQPSVVDNNNTTTTSSSSMTSVNRIGSSNSTTSTSPATTPTLEEEELLLEPSQWWVHTIAYRAYVRDEYGLVSSLSDPLILEQIEEQMRLWMDYHIRFTNQLLAKLYREKVLGLALPGMEYEILYNETESNSILDDLIIDGPGGRPRPMDDDAVPNVPPRPPRPDERIVTEPIVTQGDGLETVQELVGLCVLCATMILSCVWVLMARSHRRSLEEQAVWGSTVDTEKALQELLSVGWRVHDAEAGENGAAGARQILEIYDRTQEGMGYLGDDDSMLYGGVMDARCY